MAFALANVSSEPLTELISVSRTPLFKLSTSTFDKVLLSMSKVLFVKVSVVAFPTSVSVASGSVKVLSAVGSVIANVVSNELSVDPSKTRLVVMVELIASVSFATLFPIAVSPVAVKLRACIVPVAVRLRIPDTSKLLSVVKTLLL